MENLSNRIKSKRLYRGLSQARLAIKAGVSQPTVANWENGSHIPRKDALSRIGQALDVDESWLISGQQQQTQQTVEAYLARPIRHVPIYKWPDPGEALFAAPPEGYLPYPTETIGAFALVDRTQNELKHRLLIFDPDADNLQPEDQALWTDGVSSQIDKMSGIGLDANLLGKLKTEIRSF